MTPSVGARHTAQTHAGAGLCAPSQPAQRQAGRGAHNASRGAAWPFHLHLPGHGSVA